MIFQNRSEIQCGWNRMFELEAISRVDPWPSQNILCWFEPWCQPPVDAARGKIYYTYIDY